MKSRKLSILLAVFALIFSTLACAAGEPTLSNARTAKDSDGKELNTTFGTSDTIYVVVDLANGVKGNKVAYKWYAENVEGVDPNFLMDETETSIDEDSDYTLYSYFEPSADGWPTGSYKVEVYFNGVLNSTVAYTIQ